MSKALLAASLAVVAVLGAACGDGEGRLSKADFIAKADAICHEAITLTGAIEEPQSQEEARAAFAEFQGIFDGMLSKLRELQPPAEDEATLNEMYDKIERLVEIEGEAVDATTEEAADGFERLEAESTQLIADIEEFAQTYGFESCGIERE